MEIELALEEKLIKTRLLSLIKFYIRILILIHDQYFDVSDFSLFVVGVCTTITF